MPLESADTIEELNPLWPLGSDSKSQGDDHFRLIKGVLKAQFPGVSGDGFSIPIIATEAEINHLDGLTVNVQLKFNQIDAAYTPKVVTPTSDAPYVLRDNSWVKNGYRVKNASGAALNTDSYNQMDFVRLLFAGAVVITIGGGTEIGKTLTFEKANAAHAISFVDGVGTVYGPDLADIVEEGKMFCLVLVDTNEWRLIV